MSRATSNNLGQRLAPWALPVLSEIDVQTASGIVTSVITTRSVRELELQVGSEVIAFVKSTEVSIAKL